MLGNTRMKIANKLARKRAEEWIRRIGRFNDRMGGDPITPESIPWQKFRRLKPLGVWRDDWSLSPGGFIDGILPVQPRRHLDGKGRRGDRWRFFKQVEEEMSLYPIEPIQIAEC